MQEATKKTDQEKKRGRPKKKVAGEQTDGEKMIGGGREKRRKNDGKVRKVSFGNTKSI